MIRYRSTALRILMLISFATPVMAEEGPWRADAQQRIEVLRKGDLAVQVLDATGAPVAGAPVRVTMLRHAFPWGTCVTAAHITGTTSEDLKYRAQLAELFNCAVLENDLKWSAWRGGWGPRFSQAQTLAALQWLKDNRFRIRGHCMVHSDWKSFQPDTETLRNDLPTLRKTILEHIDEMAAFTKEYVAEWDVVNEPIHCDDAIKALGDGCIADWFQRARAALPASCRLFINEYNNVEPGDCKDKAKRTAYEELIGSLLAAKAPLEGIGFQSHFQETPASPAELLGVFDSFARFKLPIEVTEFDFNSKDETKQAAFTRDFMTVAFSHPACSGFLFWGFWEGSHWRPDGAMFRKDWAEKPNLAAYRDLVFKEWWTDLHGYTNKDGEFSMRGFKGTYRVVVGEREQETSIGDTFTRVKITQ